MSERRSEFENELPARLPKLKRFAEGLGLINLQPMRGKVSRNPTPYNIVARHREKSRKGKGRALSGVFYDTQNQCMVATDARRMFVLPHLVSAGASTIRGDDGSVIPGIFPNWQGVIPEDDGHFEMFSIDAKALHDLATASARARKMCAEKDSFCVVLYNEHGHASALNPKFVAEVMQSFRESGEERVSIGFEQDRQVLFCGAKNRKIKAVIMPLESTRMGTVHSNALACAHAAFDLPTGKQRTRMKGGAK